MLTGVLNEYPIPTTDSEIRDITTGPDGNLWFTDETSPGKIGRITPAGVITEFPIPTLDSLPASIIAGPDGSLWFTEYVSGQIGRITPAGVITEFAIPGTFALPSSITAGPDGNLWFTEAGSDKIGRITPEGAITEFPVPTPLVSPFAITAGPDGNLWFTGYRPGQIGRITPAGVITEFAIPTHSDGIADAITAGPDGNLWFTESGGEIGRIGRITPAGVITEFALPTPLAGPAGITAGPDGNLWFVDDSNDQIGRITPAGVITEFALTTIHDHPAAITVGPDGNLWFTSVVPGNIGQFDPVIGTQTQLTVAPNPASFGQNLTFTVVVSPVSDMLLPTGDVTFTIDGQTQAAVPLTSINGQATASFSIATLAPGAHSILATYGGDAGFHASTSTGTVNVVAPTPPAVIATQTQLTVAPDAAPAGQNLTFTVVVSPVSDTLLPTGSVTFTIDGRAQATVPLTSINGQARASFSIATLAPGAHSILATYGGDAGFHASTSTGTVNVVAPTPPTVIAPTPPTVIAMLRYGYGAQPTRLVLFFSAPLNPATAQDVHNYDIVGPGGRHLRVDLAAYSPQAQTVVVNPHGNLKIQYPYRLTVKGNRPGAVADIYGNLLSGAGDGRPGTDYVTTVNRSDFVRRRQSPRRKLGAGQAVKTPASGIHPVGTPFHRHVR